MKCWQHLPADIRPYCAVTMDPGSLDVKERLEIWRRMLRDVQPHNIPIVLQVAGDETEWTTPVAAVETMLKEFSCIKAVQVVEWRCAYYTQFGGELDLAIPANLRYLAELLKLCGRYGKHLSLQFQTDLAHLATDQLAGPLREVFREYRDYVLPQNECIPPSYYLAQAAACGLWLAGYCEHWGMEPQWWWWTKGESYFIRPGVFGVEAELETDEARYARLYRAFIIEGALMGATVFSIEPPQDVWHGEATDERHFDQVIYPTLRQIIEQRLIATREEVLKQAKVAYQLKECKTLPRVRHAAPGPGPRDRAGQFGAGGLRRALSPPDEGDDPRYRRAVLFHSAAARRRSREPGGPLHESHSAAGMLDPGGLPRPARSLLSADRKQRGRPTPTIAPAC